LNEQQDAIAAGAYGAFELAWSLEELTQPEPNINRLAAAVRQLRAVAPGTESHVAAALQLNELAATRVGELLRSQRGRSKQRTAAAERRLLQKVVAGNAEAEGALVAFYEAVYMRYGFIPEDGLLPQIQSALQLFYTGLDQLNAANRTADDAAGAAGQSGAAGRELMVDGIPVTVTDRAMGGGQASGGGDESSAPEFEMSGGGEQGELVSGNLRLRVVEAAATAAAGGGGGGGQLQFGDEDESEGEGGLGEEEGVDEGDHMSYMGGGSLHEDGPLMGDPQGAAEDEGGPEGLLTP
jgi:hypothetical protein